MRDRPRRYSLLWNTGPYTCRPHCDPSGQPVSFTYGDREWPEYRCWGCGAVYGICKTVQRGVGGA